MIISNKVSAVGLLAISQLAAMALWFSASAVVPALTLEYGLTGFQQSLLTSAVQAGFVVGSLLSALLGLADRLEPRRFFVAASLIAAAANAGILLVEPTSASVVVFRFITGLCMAGIYPVGMRMAATWAKGDMGLLVGLLVGALTLGSAVPHLFNALGGIDWRFTLMAASVSACLGALLINGVTLGPAFTQAARFQPRDVLFAWKVKSLRLANLGYLGHMWELYAMWAWIGVFLEAAFRVSLGGENASFWAKLAGFSVIGIGALGSIAGGFLADRWGRTRLTMAAMTVSGLCAATVGFFFAAPPWLLLIICLLWGLSIIADSAQFSASVAELADKNLVGTMLTLQTAMGFLLTLLTIHLMPSFVDWFGWTYAFAPLALGPFLGVIAMARLRRHPDSVKLAGGKG